MTSCDAELAFLDELAEAAGIPVEEKKEEADCKGNEQQGSEPVNGDGSSKGGDGAGPSEVQPKKEDPVADVKKEPDENGQKGEDGDDEETYELDATQLLKAFKAEDSKPDEPDMDPEALMKMFMDDMKEVDRGNEVHRILAAFKLNPFEQLNLRFTATEQDVKRAYRKLSLLVHPDKCAHEKAAAAFEVIGEAQKFILDADRREVLMRVLEYAREAVRDVRRKATKNDSAVRMAAALNAEGREGVEKEWEETDDFHEKWRIKSQDVLARSEFRRRKLLKRQREEDDREEKKRKEENAKRKQMRNERKEFLDTRTQRINAWREYKDSGTKVAGTKAPKIKTFDADRTYVQRATTEQFVGNYKKKPTK